MRREEVRHGREDKTAVSDGKWQAGVKRGFLLETMGGIITGEIMDMKGGAKVKIKDIRALTDLSQPAFAEKYNIPVSSLRKWEQGVTMCPEYLTELLERCVKEDVEEEREV